MTKVRVRLLIFLASISVCFSFSPIPPSFAKVPSTKRVDEEQRKLISTSNDRGSFSKTSTDQSVLRAGAGGALPTNDVVYQCFEWACNLGAPAALVAGAVIATIYENLSSGDLGPKAEDSFLTGFAKKSVVVLLLSSFILQIISIFSTTITGTMLLSRNMDELVAASKATTPLGWMKENFEFEYLTGRICFLQGLLNWLAAISIEHALPQRCKGPVATNLNRCVASSGAAVILGMLSFYNNHMTFYKNYNHMLWTYVKLLWNRYALAWPPRFLIVASLPFAVNAAYHLKKALTGMTTDNP